MIKLSLWIVSLAGAGYLAVCALLYARQRTMLYYPTPEVRPAAAQELRLENGGETLQIWHVPGDGERALIYFGGNAEDVAQNLSTFRRLFPHHALYLHNYRGYGGSSGRATESALFSDALALFEHVRSSHRLIAVMGRSLGTGVAVYLAANKEVARLVLTTPYDSVAHLAATYYPLFPVNLLIKDRFDSLVRAPRISTPTLVLIAEHDEVIPRRLSEALVAALDPGLTAVAVIPGAGHNTIGSSPRYEQLLAGFINEAVPLP